MEELSSSSSSFSLSCYHLLPHFLYLVSHFPLDLFAAFLSSPSPKIILKIISNFKMKKGKLLSLVPI